MSGRYIRCRGWCRGWCRGEVLSTSGQMVPLVGGHNAHTVYGDLQFYASQRLQLRPIRHLQWNTRQYTRNVRVMEHTFTCDKGCIYMHFNNKYIEVIMYMYIYECLVHPCWRLGMQELPVFPSGNDMAIGIHTTY